MYHIVPEGIWCLSFRQIVPKGKLTENEIRRGEYIDIPGTERVSYEGEHI